MAGRRCESGYIGIGVQKKWANKFDPAFIERFAENRTSGGGLVSKEGRKKITEN
jgi:hypothetical protein